MQELSYSFHIGNDKNKSKRSRQVMKNKNIIIEIILKDNILIIKDYGKGIKKSDLEKIKEPLYTTNYDRNKDISGLGLGLTICNKIIKYHDWTWRIDSEENSWTKTSIFLERE